MHFALAGVVRVATIVATSETTFDITAVVGLMSLMVAETLHAIGVVEAMADATVMVKLASILPVATDTGGVLDEVSRVDMGTSELPPIFGEPTLPLWLP